jgi:hypothetical protein
VAPDVENLVTDLFDYFARGEQAVDAGGNMTLNVPLYDGSHWVTVTAVPTDALHQRGPKASIKAQGPGATVVTLPGKPTLVDPGQTSATALVANTVLPSSGATATKLRAYVNGAIVGEGAITYVAGATLTDTPIIGRVGPSTPYIVRVSLITAGGIEGPLSDPVVLTTLGDTSGGGGGTVDNGKIPTPNLAGESYSVDDQAAILPYAFSTTPPDGTTVQIEVSADGLSGWAFKSPIANESPAVIFFAQSSTGDQTRYYRAKAFGPSGYTPSEYSNVVSVTAPRGSRGMV